MKTSTTTVQKLIITDVPNLDPVAVYLEDQGPECGKITITCFNDCWSYFWRAMGKDNDIRKFYLSCDEHYLAKKLAPQIDDREDDISKLTEAAKRHICEGRHNGDFTKSVARDLFERADDLEDLHADGQNGDFRDVMYDIFGDEWWYDIPKKPSYKYEYLCRIINTVKAALQEAS